MVGRCKCSCSTGTIRCANVAWEFYFAVVEPLSVVQTVMLIAWLAVDLGMVYTTCLFGPGQWEQAPWISSHLGSIVLAGTLVMIVFTWTCAQTVGAEAASFYLAYASQLWLSIASVAMLLARNNTSGHSFGIWFFRASGTGATILLYSWRYWHFPQDYPIVAEPPVIFFFVGAAVTDLIYPAVYFSLEKK